MKQGFRVDGREKPRPPPPSTSKQIPNDRPHPPTRGTNKRKNIQTSIDCSSHRSHPPAHVCSTTRIRISRRIKPSTENKSFPTLPPSKTSWQSNRSHPPAQCFFTQDLCKISAK
ncbi:hypothetical protein L210DRAFT_3435201 [Boletus edulis BED1]|uniref:Uncharacterized protein n=1 Tax=Boletus edulis BED1 TaxID=1328754 RepID=A0AAD4B986_BOLED|nr:hypothetical protein L210DRAFT_3435201 [Boletus edulis BED1]